MIKINHYSSDLYGGAGRAAYRINAALNKNGEVYSKIITTKNISVDKINSALYKARLREIYNLIRQKLDAAPKIFCFEENDTPRSNAWLGRLKASEINSSDADIVHLHWINRSMISVEEIGKIEKPLVWTLHDMWPFCGSEHLAEDSSKSRWKTGYAYQPEIKGFDVDRWVWKRKIKSWKSPIHIITPGKWLADCASQSVLMRNCPVEVIANPLDVDIYRPKLRNPSRVLFSLPLDKKLILFGAVKGTQLAYKGWDLLVPALFEIGKNVDNVEVVIFGESEPQKKINFPFKINWMGHIDDEEKLSSLYSAADIMVIPSRQESFGQTGSEAQACGCPVVAFNSTGLKDVVENQMTGILATAYDSMELASAIKLILQNETMRDKFSIEARKRAVKLWSYEVIAQKYVNAYKAIVG